MPLQSSLIHVGMGKETVQGTAVAPTVWVPVQNNLKDEDVVKWIDDKSLFAAPAAVRASYQGPISSSVDWDADFYPNSLGHALMALMGADAVTGASPYVHTLTLAKGQPPSYTQSIYDGYEERQYPGTMLDELALKWSVDAALSVSTKWIGWPSSATTESVPVFDSADPFLSWQSSLKIAGAANTRLIGFDLTAKRGVKTQLAANNTQKPKFTFSGPLDVTGKLTFAIEDDTELNYLLNNTQPAVALTLQAPSSGPSLLIQMSKCAFTKKGPSYSKEWVEVDYDVQALANSTDAGSGSPVSPVKFVLTNTQSTAY